MPYTALAPRDGKSREELEGYYRRKSESDSTSVPTWASLQSPAPVQPTHRNAGTAITLNDQWPELRLEKPFFKTYDFPGEFIDDYHRHLGEIPVQEWFPFIEMGIEGWLLRPDALKLYELAYFSTGDILELGTYKGLSTTIIANAIHNRGRPGGIYTVDLDLGLSSAARQGVEARQVPNRENIRFLAMDAGVFLKRLKIVRKRFHFAFIDHAHDYDLMADCCRMLPDVTEPGAFCLFHDYNDPRNLMPESDFAVYQAVTEHLPEEHFEFWGAFGCAALYRRV